MRGNRHAPIIIGILCIVAAVFFVIYFSGWWKYIPAVLLLGFGWPSLKTGLFASHDEIEELTGGAMSDDTAQKFKDRL